MVAAGQGDLRFDRGVMVSAWQFVRKGVRDSSSARVSAALARNGKDAEILDPEFRFVSRLTLVLLAFIAVETTVVALDATFPPDLSRARRSSPVALDRRGGGVRGVAGG